MAIELRNNIQKPRNNLFHIGIRLVITRVIGLYSYIVGYSASDVIIKSSFLW